ncbi:MAG: aspartate/tyrosine/aromatic aminotransferase [Gammaproteobacteria bacterium]|nr:aspartate/tyrosine/aromatic aminotransferase [Gammaproteobacteria bacterium]
MFESLPESKPDAILALMQKFRADERADKIDLGVGIYKDAAGKTPVMKAIKAAEQNVIQTQDTKAYVGPLGNAEFCQAMVDQVFGPEADLDRVRCGQTLGGSGALRELADLMMIAHPEAQIWVSDPTWPNHIPLLSAAGFSLQRYAYYDSETSSVDLDGMLSDLGKAKSGDLVLLHGCCHNPTGADLNVEQWQAVADVLIQRNLIPFVDIAYQGFGDGLEEDAFAVRLLAKQVPEMVVAASCSKNLALYRERAGAAMLLARDKAEADLALANLSTVIRANYSMPADHGATVVTEVMTNSGLNRQWREELESMRVRMVKQRKDFAQALRERSNSDRFDYIADQKGMFSRLPLTPDQIESLRANKGIYIVGDGRINVAGLPEGGLDALADAIVDAMR